MVAFERLEAVIADRATADREATVEVERLEETREADCSDTREAEPDLLETEEPDTGAEEPAETAD